MILKIFTAVCLYSFMFPFLGNLVVVEGMYEKSNLLTRCLARLVLPEAID